MRDDSFSLLGAVPRFGEGRWFRQPNCRPKSVSWLKAPIDQLYGGQEKNLADFQL